LKEKPTGKLRRAKKERHVEKKGGIVQKGAGGTDKGSEKLLVRSSKKLPPKGFGKDRGRARA